MNHEPDLGVTPVAAPSRALEAIYAIGHALLDQQRANEAVRVFRVMLRLAPTDERAWLGLGSCHEQMDDSTLAAELYGAGYASAQPPSARCLAALSRTMRSLGDPAMADECDAELLSVAGGDAAIELGAER